MTPNTIILDRTVSMVLDSLMDDLAHEPPQDAGGHPSVEVHERVGATWAEWDRKVASWRLLLGVMLVNRAIDMRGEGNDHAPRQWYRVFMGTDPDNLHEVDRVQEDGSGRVTVYPEEPGVQTYARVIADVRNEETL